MLVCERTFGGNVRKVDLLYLAMLFLVLLLHYIVPFTLLRECSGFELYTYWLLLAIAWIIVTGVYMEKRVR